MVVLGLELAWLFGLLGFLELLGVGLLTLERICVRLLLFVGLFMGTIRKIVLFLQLYNLRLPTHLNRRLFV